MVKRRLRDMLDSDYVEILEKLVEENNIEINELKKKIYKYKKVITILINKIKKED